MAVVTVSRQYGSGGDEVAVRVCDILGYGYFDKRMMAQVAVEAGLSESEVVDFSEQDYKAQNFLDRLLRRSGPVTQVGTWTESLSGVRSVEVKELDEQQSISLVRAAIQAVYKRGNVVIVGRGGQAILKDLPGVLHVRVEAPLLSRIERIQAQRNVSLAAAQELIAERDRAAAAYVKRFYGVDWADPTQYHLVINTGRWSIEAAAHVIASALGHLPV
jgi:cytidylate kinase